MNAGVPMTVPSAVKVTSVERRRDAEVRDHDPTVALDQNVGALHVPVHDHALVSVGEARPDLAQDVNHGFNGEGALTLQDRLEGAPFDELHRDEGNATDLSQPIDRDDVAMIASLGNPR